MTERRTVRRRSPLILLGVGTLALLLPLESVQAVYEPDPGNGQAQETAPSYATGRLIVKYKDSVTESVAAIVAAKRRFRDATTDRSGSLDTLHAKYRVRAARPIFRTEREEAAIPAPKTLS
ncbi:MAG: hypothetical protein Q8R91_04125, partial [Candidatus Omnitrophota bacterium]|nr:hypothetical protein [Candidatus Omnitrophota bacterium]